MSKAEIIAELPRLSPEDRADVQAKLDELAGEAWQDQGELSDADKQALDAALAAYKAAPDAGSSWDEVKARVQAKLRYRSPAASALVEPTARGFRLSLDEPAFGVAPGQAAVLYEDDAVVGAGLISAAA